jgi:hypothetical protein
MQLNVQAAVLLVLCKIRQPCTLVLQLRLGQVLTLQSANTCQLENRRTSVRSCVQIDVAAAATAK